MIAYEERLNQNVGWAFKEGSMHFEKESAVHRTLVKVTRQLEELGVPYALVGALALFFHGYRRFTENVDILVTSDGLRAIHEKLEGQGYTLPVTDRKVLRESDFGVRIGFLITGDLPRAGLPSSMAFPHPDQVSQLIDGVRCIRLDKLIELKLASGTAIRRRKDLADVQEVIDVLELPGALADRLDPFVRDMYTQLWNEVRNSPSQPQ